MAKKKSGSGTSDTRHPYHEYKPEKKEYYRQLELPIKLAKGKSLLSTPYHDDLRNINKFKQNADKVFKRNKKATNNVNEA